MKKLLCLVTLFLCQLSKTEGVSTQRDVRDAGTVRYRTTNIVRLLEQPQKPSLLVKTDPEKFQQITGLNPKSVSPSILQDLDNQYDATSSNTRFRD